jgi:hypothetical protein
MNVPYCTLQETGLIFKDKKVFQCSYCGAKLALDSIDTKILCFKKHDEIIHSLSINNTLSDTDNQINDYNIHTISEDHFHNEIKKIVKQQQTENREEVSSIPQTEESNSSLCSKEQIEQRLSICNSCEHFKDNSCLLCGCVVIREKNFNNKLAHKKHSCPINKWGTIE